MSSSHTPPPHELEGSPATPPPDGGGPGSSSSSSPNGSPTGTQPPSGRVELSMLWAAIDQLGSRLISLEHAVGQMQSVSRGQLREQPIASISYVPPPPASQPPLQSSPQPTPRPTPQPASQPAPQPTSFHTTPSAAHLQGSPVTPPPRPPSTFAYPLRSFESPFPDTSPAPSPFSIGDREPPSPESTAAAPSTPPPPSTYTKPKVGFIGQIERAVAGKLLTLLGALCITVGAALFLKLAVDRGWLGHLTPAVRCTGVAIIGLIMMIAGEAVRRRINAIAASGLYSAGLATVYCSIAAAWGWYNLLSPSAALASLAVVGLAGVAIAWLTRLPAVAIAGLAGAYLAPVILRSAALPSAMLPIYLTALLCTGLAIALLLRRGFIACGSLATIGSLLLGWIWAEWGGRNQPGLILAFAGLCWLAVHVYGVLISSAPARDASEPEEAESNTAGLGFGLSSRLPLPMAQMLGAGAWAAALSTSAARGLAPQFDWLPCAVLAAFALAGCALVAFRAGIAQAHSDSSAVSGALGVLRQMSPTALASPSPHASATVLLAEAMGLSIAAIAIGTTKSSAVFVCLALGLTAIAAGRRLRLTILDGYGAVLLGLAALRVVFNAFIGDEGIFVTSGVRFWGLVLDLWNLEALLAALGLIAGGRLLLIGSLNPTRRAVASALASLGVVGLWLSPLQQRSDFESLLLVLGLTTLLTSLLDLVDHRLRTDRSVLVIAIIMMVLTFLRFGPFSDYTGSSAVPLLHKGMLLAAVLCLALGRAVVIGKRFGSDASIGGLARRAGTAAIVAMAFLFTTLESARLARMVFGVSNMSVGVSLWWGILAVGAIAAGFVRTVPLLRHAGLGLLLITLGKAVLVDLAVLDGLARVASFVATGLLMIGVAGAYGYLDKRLAANRAKAS